jgi:hypothetical protein
VLQKLDSNEGDKNAMVILPWMPMQYGEQSFPFELTLLEFPIKIAFALTINRAQGLSAKRCGVLLPKICAHTVKYMLLFLAVEIPKMFLFWPSSHNLMSMS